MTNFLSELNAKQKEAACLIDRNVRVVAGAGSGKTRMLMGRIEYLIEEVGIVPSRIMAITFTNKAAKEMKERLESQLNETAKAVWISTIHKLCVRILREEAGKLGYPKSFVILDGEDQTRLIKKLIKESGDFRLKEELKPSKALHIISNWKTKGISPKKASTHSYLSDEQQLTLSLYEQYEKEKRAMFCMDFDDLLIKAHDLLEENEEIRNKWRSRFDYIHVDEFQDIDPLQYSIVKYLKAENAFLCVVGDPDQTIYTWRGAAVNIILKFDQDFKPCHTVILDKNYRSAKTILDAANAVIEGNKNRIKKDLVSVSGQEAPIELYEGNSEEQEASFIVTKMRELHKKDKIPYEEMAILYRSNYLSRYLEAALRKADIPYRIYGGIRFYERMEVKDILAYLHLLVKPSLEDPKRFSTDIFTRRIINTPKRGVGEKTIEKLEQQAKEENCCLLDVLDHPKDLSSAVTKKLKEFYGMIQDLQKNTETISLPFLVHEVLEKTGYEDYLKNQKEEERIENVVEIAQDIAAAIKEQPDLTLEEYLQNISLLTDAHEENTHTVSLLTVHASKGTEYDAVFVASLNEGVFPSQKAIDENQLKGLEEERRLLYVAMTRARKQLTLSWNKDYSFISGTKRASRFLMEVPEDCTYSRLGPVDGKGSRSKTISVFSSNALSKRKDSKSLYRTGDWISHTTMGEGMVIHTQDEVVEVAFPAPFGIKKLKSNFAGMKKIKK